MYFEYTTSRQESGISARVKAVPEAPRPRLCELSIKQVKSLENGAKGLGSVIHLRE